MPFAAGDDLTAAALNGIAGIWTDYTVAWTSTSGTQPAIGNGTKIGRYCLLGKLVIARINIAMGSTTTYGNAGAYNFSLPFTAQTASLAGNLWPSMAQALDAGTGYKVGIVQVSTGATVCSVIDPAVGGFYAFNAPQTWAVNDQLMLQAMYEIP